MIRAVRVLPTLRRWCFPLLAGALLGLCVFAWEGAQVLGSNAVGLHVDVKGPLAELLAAVRPLLPGLIARAGLAYALLGGALGLLAWGLTAWLPRTGPTRWAAWLGTWAGVLGLTCVAKAIERPALFDDLPFGRGLLRFLVDRADPWEGWLALALFIAPQGVLVLVLWVRLWLSRARVPPERAGAFTLRTPALSARGRAQEESRSRWATSRVRRVGALAVALLFVLGAVFGLRTSQAKRPHPPLVLLFGIDAFRPDRVERGPHVAPNLEALLQDATRFTRAYTPIAQTEPAWRALVTARWPSRTGVRFPLTPHADWVDLPTVPGALAGAGVGTTFRTDCSRFNYLGAESGFARRIEPPKGALNFLMEKLRFRLLGVFFDNRIGSALLPEWIDNRALAGLYDPHGYAKRLLADLEAQASRGPTFYAFHDTAAHFPGDPVYPFYRRYVPSNEPLERRLRMVYAPIAPGSHGGWTREGAEALYDELLAQADAQLGVVLDGLRRDGLYDDAWIIVFSDHGESFYADRPLLQGATPEHGARLDREENRMLLAVKPPRAFKEAPRRVDALVRLIDLGPTVLEALGLPPLPAADGKSLLGLMRKKPEPPRWLYAETGYTHASPDAFDPGHYTSGPRTFAGYQILPDGAVQMTPAAARGALREKDVGAFDGVNWRIDSPRKDGSVLRRCVGTCSPALDAFLARTR